MVKVISNRTIFFITTVSQMDNIKCIYYAGNIIYLHYAGNNLCTL